MLLLLTSIVCVAGTGSRSPVSSGYATCSNHERTSCSAAVLTSPLSTAGTWQDGSLEDHWFTPASAHSLPPVSPFVSLR